MVVWVSFVCIRYTFQLDNGERSTGQTTKEARAEKFTLKSKGENEQIKQSGQNVFLKNNNSDRAVFMDTILVISIIYTWLWMNLPIYGNWCRIEISNANTQHLPCALLRLNAFCIQRKNNLLLMFGLMLWNGNAPCNLWERETHSIHPFRVP